MPDLDGIEVCRRIQRSTSIPVLMLTARGDEADVVLGLEVGADDYLTKPFSQRELMARVRAILRRIERERAAESDSPVTVSDLAVDVARRTVTRQGRTLQLTPTEFDLLAFLAARPGVVFSRLALLADVWGYRDGSGRAHGRLARALAAPQGRQRCRPNRPRRRLRTRPVLVNGRCS